MMLAGVSCRAWAMEPTMLSALFESYRKLPALSGPSDPPATRKKNNYVVDSNGIATVPIKGTLIKGEIPWWFEFLGIDATSMSDATSMVLAADSDPNVSTIFLDIDSPGGTLDGTQELADAVASTKKPTVAHASDLMASAAYWIGSQTDVLTANKSAFIGSIGVYSVMSDSSRLYKNAGVDVHVIRSAHLKGAGIAGDRITGEQLSAEQDLINKAASLFASYVAKGRKMDTESADSVSTGQLWMAEEAHSLGLIDAIKNFEKPTAMRSHKSKAVVSVFKEQKKMSDESNMEISALREKAAALEAQNKKLASDLDATVTARRSDLMEKYRAHVAPANIKAVEEYGQFCGQDVGRFEAYLKSLQPVVHPDRSTAPFGGIARQPPDASIVGVAMAIGTTTEKIELSEKVVGVMANGRLLLSNGKTVDAKEAFTDPGKILAEVN